MCLLDLIHKLFSRGECQAIKLIVSSSRRTVFTRARTWFIDRIVSEKTWALYLSPKKEPLFGGARVFD